MLYHVIPTSTEAISTVTKPVHCIPLPGPAELQQGQCVHCPWGHGAHGPHGGWSPPWGIALVPSPCLKNQGQKHENNMNKIEQATPPSNDDFLDSLSPQRARTDTFSASFQLGMVSTWQARRRVWSSNCTKIDGMILYVHVSVLLWMEEILHHLDPFGRWFISCNICNTIIIYNNPILFTTGSSHRRLRLAAANCKARQSFSTAASTSLGQPWRTPAVTFRPSI